jgi:hypothetical protein
MPAGSAGIMAASYGMEAILKPIEVSNEEPEEEVPAITDNPVVPDNPVVEPKDEPGE